MAKVKIENISKKFGQKTAVKEVNLEIKDKELACFAGPPGSGKTTVFRIVAGLQKPDSGEVYFDDERVTHLPPGEREVGFFFEILALFPNKTGFENIAFPLRVRRVPEKEIKKKVIEVARLLKVEHILDREPRTFSGGEMQRIALARTIVWPRRVLILDEPLSNIDALLRVSMRAEFKKLKEELRETILYATHDPIEAMAVGDRVCVMHNGEVQQYAIPKEVFNHPNNRFVAGFVGSPPMNFIDVSLEEEGDRLYLDQGTFRMDVTKYGKTIKEGASSSELTLGIRPEYIIISDKPLTNSAKSQVYVTEPLGFRTVIDFKVGKDTIVKVIGEAGVSCKLGDVKWIIFPTDKIHVIDKKTEKVLV
mgnify:CR=1 FL=1